MTRYPTREDLLAEHVPSLALVFAQLPYPRHARGRRQQLVVGVHGVLAGLPLAGPTLPCDVACTHADVAHQVVELGGA